MERRIEVATVVYYDGVSAYTTHRALYIDADTRTMTEDSKKALEKDMESAGCTCLLVDFNNFGYYDNSMEFCRSFVLPKWWDKKEYNEELYIKEKFIEYFC